MGALLTNVLKSLPETVLGGLAADQVLKVLNPSATTTNGATVNGPTISAAAFATMPADTQKLMVSAGYHIV